MAPTVNVQTNAKEPIGALVTGQDRERLTGLTNIKLFIRRVSDNQYFDWDDNTFKLAGSITTFLLVLSEADAVSNPGFYQIDNTDHPDGQFDFSKITNKASNDIYHFMVIQDGNPQDALNVPQTGEIKEGAWLDYIDRAISDSATPAQVQAELENIRLHQLIQADPAGSPATSGTFIDQLIDTLNTKAGYVVLQTYSYNQTANRLEGIVWVESGNLIFNTGDLGTCTVNWYDKEGTLMWSESDDTPDAQGFYKIEKSPPDLVSDQLYYATASVAITGVGTVSGGKGNFTF